MPLKLIFLYMIQGNDSIPFFPCQHTTDPVKLIKKTTFSPLYLSVTYIINQLTVYEFYFYAIYYSPLVCISIVLVEWLLSLKKSYLIKVHIDTIS